jgi:hypothetical protein
MSFRATTLRRLLFVALSFIAISGISFAQQAAPVLAFSKEDAVVATLVQALNETSSNEDAGSSNPEDTKWLKVEFHYSVNPAVGKYLDEVQFKVWIEGRDLFDPQGQPGKGIPVMLIGTVTYANIPKGTDNYGVVYVHPFTLGRYSTELGPTDFDRTFNVHVEADIAGSPVDSADKNKEQDPNWYQQYKMIPGLVYRQDQCPFINDNPSRYPAIKLPDASSSSS